MLDLEGQALRAEVVSTFHHPMDEPLEDEEFNRLALRVFAYQFERNSPFGAYCRRRGRSPDTVDHWTEVPAVPTAAFREVRLLSGDPGSVEAVFRTSGTTAGPERRGEHPILDLSLYHAALIPNFTAHVLPDGAEPPMLSLVPPPAQLQDSSLAAMIAVVLDRLGSDGSGGFAGVESGIDDAALARSLARFTDEDTPVCLLGTAFAFVHWTDRVRERGERFRLPAGSRLMDTGGFKGRSREVPAAVLRQTYTDLLGIPADHCINEYGMTELCSQFYDPAFRERVQGHAPGPQRLKPPPWLRTRVVDPATLEPLPAGETGILQHVDLANLGSVMAVQTDDLGRAVDDGFVVLGRAAGAPPRGCSIAMELLLQAVERERR